MAAEKLDRRTTLRDTLRQSTNKDTVKLKLIGEKIQKLEEYDKLISEEIPLINLERETAEADNIITVMKIKLGKLMPISQPVHSLPLSSDYPTQLHSSTLSTQLHWMQRRKI